MKIFILLLLSLILSACAPNNNQGDFINYDCNIPIIECIIEKDTVNLIIDSGAEYSLLHTQYYRNNYHKFTMIKQVETQFHGIGGTTIQKADVINASTSMGYITFIEQDLKEVIYSMPQYNIVGLLGSDFLSNHNFIIDYNVKKIYPYEQLDSIYGKSYR